MRAAAVHLGSTEIILAVQLSRTSRMYWAIQAVRACAAGTSRVVHCSCPLRVRFDLVSCVRALSHKLLVSQVVMRAR